MTVTVAVTVVIVVIKAEFPKIREDDSLLCKVVTSVQWVVLLGSLLPIVLESAGLFR